ncbi:MAG: winged helix-turn-helix transcriptional regulator [Rhodobacteraceae bacterium]|nr:winged helix-turn-helix transcriptional regulator [Paracoccaceae bacterium]
MPDSNKNAVFGIAERLDLDNIPPGASLLSVVVYRLSRLLRAQTEQVLSYSGVLSVVDWRIILGLFMRPSATQKELIEFVLMHQAQVSRSLAMLEDQGLIKSERSMQDKRARLFSLTQRGLEIYQQNSPTITEFCEAIDQCLSPAETKQFLDFNMRIAKASMESGNNLAESRTKKAS